MHRFLNQTEYGKLIITLSSFDHVLIEYKQDLMYEKGLFLGDSDFFDFFSHPAVYGNPEAGIKHLKSRMLLF